MFQLVIIYLKLIINEKNNLLKIFKIQNFKFNISWLVFDKVFRASLNIILSIILARSLGPEDFGILNYLLAYIFLFTSISSLGINPVLTNKIIKDGKKSNHNILINSYYFRLIFSLLNYTFFLILIKFINNDNVYNQYSTIIGLTIILKSSEVFFSYFEAKSLSKFIVISQSLGLIVSFVLIICIFIFSLDDIYIYYALVLDVLVVFILINIFYFLKIKLKFTKINWNIFKKILKKSYPVLISSLSIILYMRIDQIMINSLLDEYNLGIYSVGVRFVEIFHFVPKILMISILPIILLSKKYYQELLNINSFIFKISIFIVIILYLGSDFLINLFFGQNYLESVEIAKVLSLSIIFVFYGVINEHWYVKNNLQIYYAINVLIGAILNIILNYYLIKLIGIKGAAIATIFTYVFIIFIFDATNKKTYKLFRIKLKSLTKL